jgi:hypothetical protein
LFVACLSTKPESTFVGQALILEPWIVEAAFARLGGRELSAEEQRVVLAATRTPRKARCPEWWEKDLRDRK